MSTLKSLKLTNRQYFSRIANGVTFFSKTQDLSYGERFELDGKHAGRHYNFGQLQFLHKLCWEPHVYILTTSIGWPSRYHCKRSVFKAWEACQRVLVRTPACSRSRPRCSSPWKHLAGQTYNFHEEGGCRCERPWRTPLLGVRRLSRSSAVTSSYLSTTFIRMNRLLSHD